MRSDLEVSNPQEGEEGYVVLVRDPRTGELYEFSEEDHFLLSCLDGETGAPRTIAEFEESFDQRVTADQLQMFIAMVAEWGLLEPDDSAASRGAIVPFTGEEDADSELIVPTPGGAMGQGNTPSGGRLDDRQGMQGRRGERAQGMARPGLISTDPPEPAELVDRTAEAREPLEALEAPGLGRRGGGGMGGGRGMGRGGGMGGGRGGMGRGGGMGGGRGGGGGASGPQPDWEPQQTVATEDKPLDHPPHWTWFYKPQAFFAGLASWLWPLRWLAYIAPITIGLGMWTLFNHYSQFFTDYTLYRRPMTLFQHLVFSLFTVNIMVQVGRGIIGAACGAEVLRFGIRLAVGIVPRFGTQIGSLAGLDKTRLLWLHSGPLFIRAHIFAFSAMFWYMTRESGTALHGIFLLLTTMGGLSFFLTANPLLRTPGYHLVTTLLDMPDLRQRANRALFSTFKGGQRTEDGTFALRMYALASLIWLCCVVCFVLYLIGSWLELNYSGMGVSVFLALIVLLVLRFRNQGKKRAEKRTADRARNREARVAELRGGGAGMGGRGMGGRAGAMGGRGGMGGMGGGMGGMAGARLGGGGAMPRGGTMARGGGPMGPGGGPRALARLPSGMPGEVQPAHGALPKKKGNPFIRYGLLALFIALMFVPYHYEPGGPVTIYPLQQQEVHGEISGILDEVPFNGGEEVATGTLIAKISSLEEERHVQETRAEIAKRQADLEELLSTPRPEDVQLAQQKLDTARTSAQFSREEVTRLEPVFKGGHISLEDFEQSRKRANVDAQQVLEAESELRKVKAGPHPKEIEALRYEIAGLQEALVYYEQQLEKTNLYMPFDGRITTINLRDKLGLYLKKGDLFATVENDQQLRVEFDVPESDVGDFGVGSAVRIKIWTYPDRVFAGKVTEIAPAVDSEHEEGEVLKVTTIIDNTDGALVSGMTGYGKIDGGTMPVGVAFSRAIVRFFLIEVWSWLP